MPTLQEMLGDSYKEGMTIDEVASFFEGKKFVDLSTGNYVDKDKFDKQVSNLTKQLNDTKNQLNDKLTDEEKNIQASQQQADRIKELEGLLKANTVASNKTVVNNLMTNVRDILGLDPTDKEYVSFVDGIATEDGEKTNKVASYIAKLIEDVYDKGKKDADKDAMGNFGKNKGQGGKDSTPKAIGDLGKELASKNAKKENYDYFK